MNGGQYRGGCQGTVREWEKVEMIVQQVKFGGSLKGMSNVQTFPHLGVQGGVLGVGAGANGGQFCLSQRVFGGKKGNVNTPLYQPFGE